MATPSSLNPMHDPRQGRTFLIALAVLFTVFTGLMGFFMARLPSSPFTVGFMGVCLWITALLWVGGLKPAIRSLTLRILALLVAILMGVNLGHGLWMMAQGHAVSWSAGAGFLLFGVPALAYAGWGRLMGPLPTDTKPTGWRAWTQHLYVLVNLAIMAGAGIVLAQLSAYLLHLVP